MTTVTRIGADLNGFTFGFDEELLETIRGAYRDHVADYLAAPEQSSLFEGGRSKSGEFGTNDQQFYYITYRKAPLFWVSNNNWHTYGLFRDLFDALDIKESVKGLVDYKDDITLYSGFFVVGDRGDTEHWHVDYHPGANAYTLITPLFDLQPGQGNLLYRNSDRVAQTYPYKVGEAIIFGDQFSHTTEPYPRTDGPRVLLSLQFGTDKPVHWNILKKTIASQSLFLVLPCGHQRGTCQCSAAYETAPANASPQQGQQPVSRNAPCPCGSGKRYKHCHGISG